MPAAFIIFVGMIGVGEGKACVILDRAIFATLVLFALFESQFNQFFTTSLSESLLKDNKFPVGPRVGAVLFEWLRRPDVGFRPHLALSLRLRFNG